MFNWAKNAVGITEREYGPSAIQSVAQQTSEQQWTELKRDDLKWEVMQGTNVETKTFYMTSDSGKLGLAQIIYSDVLGVRTTAQFNSKIIDAKTHIPELWASDNLDKYEFSPDKQDFHSQNVTMELSKDGKSYHIKSTANKGCIVDLTFTQTAPGFAVGKNGTSTFGTDPAKPWGRMSHVFWPRCQVTGSLITQKFGEVDFTGRGVFIHALQGMKPHFAAAKWNFANFQSPSYSAIFMEYTTPPSYGTTVVSVGGIAVDGQILFANSQSPAVHDETHPDSDNAWPEPSAVTYKWSGKTADGKDATAELKGSLTPRMDRVDVMGELPKFVKNIVVGASGTKPYIYQYCPELTLKLKIGDEVKEEQGQLFMEATFIS